MTRTAVIGAGMVGLVTALRLVERGDEVVVFERDTVPGGLAASFVPVAGGDPLERFYHHIFRTDHRIVALIHELGLGERLIWAQPITTCLYDGRLERLDSPASLLAFSALAPAERLRLALALGILKLAPSAAPFEDRLGPRWLRTVGGRNAYRVIFEPLFAAKFGAHAEDISLAWFWARIHDRTASLGYMGGGFSALYERLAERIRAGGGRFEFGAPVTRIERTGATFAIARADSAHPDTGFDRVIATVPLRVLATLAPDLPADFLAQYTPAPGLWARCLVLALDRPLTDAYWINVCEQNAPFMVAVEHTNLIDPARYGGRHLVYLGNYAPAFPRVPAQSLVAEFTPYLRRLNPQFSIDWVVDAWQFCAPDAQPIVTPGYRARIAPHQTPIPGLFVGNLYQVYPHDRGQNYAVALAESLVDSLDRAIAESAA
ncbi:MAG: NAD(P)/FAD-dependent oxidoreductase [Vulcanimicrobiaceae bacterium]